MKKKTEKEFVKKINEKNYNKKRIYEIRSEGVDKKNKLKEFINKNMNSSQWKYVRKWDEEEKEEEKKGRQI